MPEDKPTNFTKDVLLPSKMAYQTYGIKPPDTNDVDEIIKGYCITEARSSNLILNIMRDLFFLPKAIKQEYKRKMQKRQAEKIKKSLDI